MRAGAPPLSPNLLKFTDFFTSPTEISKNLEQTLDSVGGDTLWTKILEKPNYYVKENPEMSVL
jgi:hypothetical protein